MTRFQIIGMAALVFILFSYFRRFRRTTIDKLLVVLMLLTGIFFVLYPETTNKLAHFLGIGRGADLIFYMAILYFGYILLVLYAKIKKLEDQIVVIVRKQALENIAAKEKSD